MIIFVIFQRPSGKIRYTMTGSLNTPTAHEFFVIGPTSGIITVAKSLYIESDEIGPQTFNVSNCEICK